MYDANFINSVVERGKLDAETMKYASACSKSRPTDTVAVQKTFIELYKQHRGEYMGSLLTGMVESMLPIVKNDRVDDVQLGDEVFSKGLNNVVKDIDMEYPPERSEEHTSELQSLMRISYAVFFLKTKNKYTSNNS